MASRESVIPLWIEQIKSNREITVTDHNMTRFMMTLEDAVDLVLFAFSNGCNRDLFVQKAPAATLEIWANALKELLKKDVKIRTIGTRHGEKLYESLVTREEIVKAIDMENYFRIPCDERDLNYERYFIEGKEEISKVEDYNSHNTHRLNCNEMKELLLKLDIVKSGIPK